MNLKRRGAIDLLKSAIKYVDWKPGWEVDVGGEIKSGHHEPESEALRIMKTALQEVLSCSS